jgi:hypothetical protein
MRRICIMAGLAVGGSPFGFVVQEQGEIMKTLSTIKLGAVFTTAAMLFGLATVADAAPRPGKPSLAPSITSPEAADKTVVIKDSTKHVNVYEDETVLFIVGDKKFAVRFDGNSYVYDLATIAPPDTLNHKVKVYVGPNPEDPWLEKP